MKYPTGKWIHRGPAYSSFMYDGQEAASVVKMFSEPGYQSRVVRITTCSTGDLVSYWQRVLVENHQTLEEAIKYVEESSPSILNWYTSGTWAHVKCTPWVSQNHEFNHRKEQYLMEQMGLHRMETRHLS